MESDEGIWESIMAALFTYGTAAGTASEGLASGAEVGAAIGGGTTITGLTPAGAMLATGVVSSGVSAGLAAAMKPKIPGPPNLGATSEEAKMQAAAAMKLRGKRGRESTIMTGVSSPNAPAANPVKNVLGL